MKVDIPFDAFETLHTLVEAVKRKADGSLDFGTFGNRSNRNNDSLDFGTFGNWSNRNNDSLDRSSLFK